MDLGNARYVTLEEAWNSKTRQEIIKIWEQRDPEHLIGCYECIHMAEGMEPY